MMRNAMQSIQAASICRNIVISGLLAASIALILWAGAETWRYPCPETSAEIASTASACISRLRGLEPLIVGVGFWSVGLITWYARQSAASIGFFLLSASVLAAGQLSVVDNSLGSRLFSLALTWMSPLTVHFHCTVFGRALCSKQRLLVWMLYGLAALLTLPLILIWPLEALRALPWFTSLNTAIRLNIMVGLVLSVVVLVYNYHTLTSVVTRQRLRLFVAGSFLAFLPLLLFSLLPETVRNTPALPYEITLPWLLLSPLAYVYAIFRYRLVQVERMVNRAASYYMLAILLLAVYLATTLALPGHVLNRWPFANALLSVGLLLLALPLQKLLQHLMNWIWYGHTLHYIDVVEHLSGLLALTLDRATLRQLLIDELADALHLAGVALWIKDQPDSLMLLGATGFNVAALGDRRLPIAGQLVRYLDRQAAPIASARVRFALDRAALLPGEQVLLELPNSVSWLPLRSGGVLQGILLIGPWRGDSDLNAEDERILATLARQSAIAVHNVLLIEQVHLGHRELTRAHQQLLMEREQTQQRLAQELHDGPVQQIFGISYQLGGLQRRIDRGEPSADIGAVLPQELEELRHEIVNVGTQLRNMIGDLCPAGLDELGLTDALEGYVRRLRRLDDANIPQIVLDLDESGTLIEETIATCLFRVAQEALRNVVKHAQATQAVISLRLHADEAVLMISDDGRGFRMPPRLTELTQANHFGLVGMTERVAWAGGQLSIRSRVGAGTEVLARIPLQERPADQHATRHALAVGAST
ncbi:MAG TPA: ATP-binding protein [Herpetosiphonaceae bacterium]